MKEFNNFSFTMFSFVNEANWIIMFCFLPVIVGILVAFVIMMPVKFDLKRANG